MVLCLPVGRALGSAGRSIYWCVDRGSPQGRGSPHEYVLDSLYTADPARVADYSGLAIAIAVVYDLPPPPGWPHFQVSERSLPRQLPTPEAAFAFWSKADLDHRTLHKLKQLTAAELKFVVDSNAAFEEMKWAQENIRLDLPGFSVAYDMVRYRRDRAQENVMIWPGQTYELPEILKQGGICVDQAYFAATAGKAKGVPTLIFRGAGLDGRHAWFGYLDLNHHWVLDAGRYAERKYVSGVAYDPQTWGNLSDHELAFLTEDFRRLQPYRNSRIHAEFADEFLRRSDFDAAQKAARRAVNFEHRNVDAWNILLTAQQQLHVEPKVAEATLREAAIALQRYPDLEATFINRLAASLRTRGETSAADYEEGKIARKNQSDRSDISVSQAREIMMRSMQADETQGQLQTYTRILSIYGKGAGIDFFDKVVQVFIARLQYEGKTQAALQVALQAQATLKIDPDSQLDHELKDLIKKLGR